MAVDPLANIVARLSTAETDLYAIRLDLCAVIKAAHAETITEEPPKAVAEPVPAHEEPELVVVADVSPQRSPGRSRDIEALLAGRWLNGVGLLLVFIGAAFFLKVAFDHDWITPVFRVGLGFVVGAIAIAYAQRLAGKGQIYFSEGITALGAGIEFLSLYASSALFHFVHPAVALAGMAAVNAAIASIAWRRHSERLGVLAAIGGFLAPLLAGTQNVDPWTIAGYIGMLDIGLLLLAELIDSRIVTAITLGGTMLYALGNFSTTHALGDTQRAIIYATLYATFAVAGWIATRTRSTLDVFRSIVGGIALGGLLFGLEWSLEPQHRTLLALALLALTVAHLGAAIVLRSRYQSWLAVAALTLAIPAAFERESLVDIAWAIEATILMVAGLRFNDAVLKVAALSLLAFDVLRDLSMGINLDTHLRPIVNERFAAWAATFMAAFAMARAIDISGTAEYDAVLLRALRTAGHAIALLSLSFEAWCGVAYYGGTSQGSSAALSVVWALFATVLIACGLYKRDAFVRWEGLGLIVLTIAKVFVLDLSFLDIGYRVISAILVGVALIGVSYAYQRRLANEPVQP